MYSQVCEALFQHTVFLWLLKKCYNLKNIWYIKFWFVFRKAVINAKNSILEVFIGSVIEWMS